MATSPLVWDARSATTHGGAAGPGWEWISFLLGPALALSSLRFSLATVILPFGGSRPDRSGSPAGPIFPFQDQRGRCMIELKGG